MMRLEYLLLSAELKTWRQAGYRPRLWWRDDGAVCLRPRLRRLVALSHYTGIPLSIAASPSGFDEKFGDTINAQPQIRVLYYDAGADLTRTPRHAGTRFAVFQRYTAVYVRPSNQLAALPPASVASAGFSGISAFGELLSTDVLPRVDVHLQLMDEQACLNFQGRRHVLGRLAGLLRDRRLAGRWHEPVGLLTHHAAHTDAAWRFLAWLLQWGPIRDGAQWCGVEDLLNPPDQTTRQ